MYLTENDNVVIIIQNVILENILKSVTDQDHKVFKSERTRVPRVLTFELRMQ